jgi:hypothetical protein
MNIFYGIAFRKIIPLNLKIPWFGIFTFNPSKFSKIIF